MEYRAEVRMVGLIMLCPPVEFTCEGTKIALRPTTREDLETEHVPHSFGGIDNTPYPSAIMNLTLLGHSSRAVQEELKRVIAGLRLFRVASAAALWYSIETDSVTGLAGQGMIHRLKPAAELEKGVIRESESDRLVFFLKHILPLLSPSIFSSARQNRDSLVIAYNRYSDALFDNSCYESRIAGSIMALEALLLGGDEKQELGFKLSTRAARLLAYFGDNAIAVRDCLKLAYRIRSQYVHGGLATPRDNRRVEDGYGNKAEFCHVVLNATRKVFLIAVLLSGKKKALIESVDTALISGTFEGTTMEKHLALALEYIPE